MYQYFIDHPKLAILFIAIVVAIVIYFIVSTMRTIGMEKVRKAVYRAFIDAERHFQYGDNQAKFEYVVEVARKAVPSPFDLFITEEFMRKVIQLWFDLCKDLLDDGRVNGTGHKESDAK